VTLKSETENKEYDDFFPNIKLKTCGTHLTERKCENSVKITIYFGNNQVLYKFSI